MKKKQRSGNRGIAWSWASGWLLGSLASERCTQGAWRPWSDCCMVWVSGAWLTNTVTICVHSCWVQGWTQRRMQVSLSDTVTEHLHSGKSHTGTPTQNALIHLLPDLQAEQELWNAWNPVHWFRCRASPRAVLCLHSYSLCGPIACPDIKHTQKVQNSTAVHFLDVAQKCHSTKQVRGPMGVRTTQCHRGRRIWPIVWRTFSFVLLGVFSSPTPYSLPGAQWSESFFLLLSPLAPPFCPPTGITRSFSPASHGVLHCVVYVRTGIVVILLCLLQWHNALTDWLTDWLIVTFQTSRAAGQPRSLKGVVTRPTDLEEPAAGLVPFPAP